MIFCSRPSLFWGTARTPLLLLFVVNFFCRTKNSTIVWLWSSSPSHSELSKKFPKVSKNRLLEMNKNNFTLIRQKIWAFKNLYPEANEWFKIQLCKNCSKELQQRTAAKEDSNVANYFGHFVDGGQGSLFTVSTDWKGILSEIFKKRIQQKMEISTKVFTSATGHTLDCVDLSSVLTHCDHRWTDLTKFCLLGKI